MHLKRTIACAVIVGSSLVCGAGPAAANSYSTTHAGVTASWSDGTNTFSVSGGSYDRGEIRRPNGAVVSVTAGSSQRFPNLVEDQRISIRACNYVPNLPDDCGAWVNGYS